MLTLDELHDALLFTSADASADQAAYLDRKTGYIHLVEDSIAITSDPLPDDLDDEQKYLRIPRARDLDLGTALAFDFADEVMPDFAGKISDIFSRKSAYARFKNLLLDEGQLDAWHRYQERATLKALRAWCQENGIAFSEPESP